MRPRLLVFASGSKDGGGSGFEKLVESGLLNITGVVSNHEHGGVRQRADRLGIRFTHFPKPWTASHYKALVDFHLADFVTLSGWLKLVSGLDPRTTTNIHPGPLPEFGGKGMYGHHVHEAVIDAFKRGEITHSAVTMHFVNDEYDDGPIFFEHKIKIEPEDTAGTLAAKVNAAEHEHQAFQLANLIDGFYSWDGVNPNSFRQGKPSKEKE